MRERQSLPKDLLQVNYSSNFWDLKNSASPSSTLPIGANYLDWGIAATEGEHVKNLPLYFPYPGN